jgi:sugar lactone lactonase YvrE
MPAALSLSPDQAMLVVGDGQSKFSWFFQIAQDGSLVNGEPFFRLEMPEMSPLSGVDSVTMDSIGQVYFASAMGIQVCEQNGRCAQILSKPEQGVLGNIAFAGKDLNWIYASVGGKLFRRPSKQTGVSLSAPVKPPKPPL